MCSSVAGVVKDLPEEGRGKTEVGRPVFARECTANFLSRPYFTSRCFTVEV